MKIAVNCWVLRNKQIDGIGNFTIETVRRLIANHPEIDFQILCDKNFTERYFDFPNATKHRIFPPYRHPLLYLFYMEFVVGKFLRNHRPDIFVSTDGFLCLSSKCLQLPVIHDLNFEHQPKDLPFRNRVYFRNFYHRFAHKGKRVATVSEYSKADIAKTYGLDPGKIDVVSSGVKEGLRPLDADTKQMIKEKYSGGADYFFFVGSMHPRKNIIRLLQAFEIFKNTGGSAVKLILAGNILWGDEQLQSVFSSAKFKEEVIYTGRISEKDLANLLGSALALTFVPTFEGFGLPIVEAFRCGIPVICSNTTSMPEIAGDAALLADPFNVNDIAGKMLQVSADAVLRNDLIEKGYKQEQTFSWSRTALLLFDSIRSCLS